MNNLIKIIKQETGLTIHEFCQQELETKYNAFNIRVRNARMHPAEIFYIVYRTRKSLVDLFGQSWQELLINSQGGPIADKVRGIIEKMSDEDKNQIAELMGLQAPKVQLPEKKKDEPEPIIQVEKKEETPSEEKPLSALDKIFIPTY